MTFLHKLAKRLALIPATIVLFPFLTSCQDGTLQDFLGPDPGNHSKNLVSLSIAPRDPQVALGDSARFAATGWLSSGESAPIQVNWSASGGSISSTGWFRPESSGEYWVRAVAASQASLKDSVRVTAWIAPGNIVRLDVLPALVTLPRGESQQFVAHALMADGSTINPTVSWAATGGTITPTGLFTASGAEGPASVTASLGGGFSSGSAEVVVHPAALTQLVLNPRTAIMEAGETRPFTAAASWSDGAATLPPLVWNAEGGVLSPDHLYTAGSAPGTYRVIVSSAPYPKADTSLITILPRITGLRISPATASLSPGATQPMQAFAVRNDGTEASAGVSWSATGGNVALNGTYQAGNVPGQYRVVGTLQALNGQMFTDTAKIAITNSSATLVQLAINPHAPSVVVGSTLQFGAAGTWSDGSSAVPAVTWSGTGGSIDAYGLYTAGQTPGSYRVIATQFGGSRADTALVTVVARLTGFHIAPKADTITTGQSRQFTTSLSWSDNQSHPVSIAWSGTGGAISQSGVYSPSALAGTFLVIAACSCGAADTAVATVRSPNPPASPTLMSLVLSPHLATLALGAFQQFSASGAWSDGSAGPIGVTYEVSGGDISSAGVYHAGSTPGTYRIVAVQQGGARADTAFVTINAGPTLTELVLNPSSVTLPPGGTQQFALAASWSDGGSTVPPVVYGATGGTITTSGLYTAGTTPGTYGVIVTQQGGTMADTSVVTISASPGPTLTALVMNPSSVFVFPGATQQFVVSASWSDGSSTLPPLGFSATGGSISAGGLYTAGTLPGAYQVIARHVGGTKADTSSVTIPTLTALAIAPKPASIAAGGTQLFSVGGTWSNGATMPPSVTYSATGGTISPAGLYSAGSAVGTYQVIARHSYGTRADTSVVTITAVLPPLPPPSVPVSSDTVPLRIERLDGGSGDVLVSNGIPLRPGRLQGGDLSHIRVMVNGVEQPSYIEVLKGHHKDGSSVSILVQFHATVGAVPMIALLDFSTSRSAPSIAKTPVAWSLPAAVALPISPDYLVSTGFMGPTVTAASAPQSPSVYPTYESNFVQYSDYQWQYFGAGWGGDYYDRAWSHFAFWARTGNSTYWVRAAQLAYNYRTGYLEPNAYGSSEYWAQLEGLVVHYWLTGDEQSRAAVYMTSESLGRSRGGPQMANTTEHPWMDSRVQARVLLSELLSIRVEAPAFGVVSDWADAARNNLGFILSSQAADGSYRFSATCGQSNNFMSGMLDEAYAYYYDWLEPDPRLPPAIQRNLDWLWNTQWRPADQVFNYYSGNCAGEGGPTAADDLNGIYLAAWGWYYRFSGNPAYRDQGEQMFSGMVQKTFLAGSKQFNQAYHSSYQWLFYR